MDDTKRELERMCKDIAETLGSFCDGMFYDTEKGKMVSKIPKNNKDEDRYQTLYDYLVRDNLGIKIKTDIKGATMYSCEICVAWGGPNIYIDTGSQAVEGYWGADKVSHFLPRKICDAIDDVIDEERSCYL